MLNSVSIYGIIDKVIKNDINEAEFIISCTRNFKELDCTFKKDIFKCYLFKRGINTSLSNLEVGKGIIVHGSILQDQNNEYYIDVYSADIM